MPAMTSSTVVARSDDAIAAPLGEDLAMMDIERGRYFVLDDIGHAIWSRLETPRRVSELVDDLQARYDVTREQCERDVIALLVTLHAKGLVGVRA
jgi:hypothetical protein